MNLIQNKQDLFLLIKAYITSALLILLLFSVSVFVFTKLNHQQKSQVVNHEEDAFSQFLQKEKISSNISSNESYVIYAKIDPVIHRIEIFLAKNKDNLTQEELAKVEKFRSERITYLMAKKYKDITR